MSIATSFRYTNKKGRDYYYDTQRGTTTFDRPRNAIVIDAETEEILFQPKGIEVIIERESSDSGQSKPLDSRNHTREHRDIFRGPASRGRLRPDRSDVFETVPFHKQHRTGHKYVVRNSPSYHDRRREDLLPTVPFRRGSSNVDKETGLPLKMLSPGNRKDPPKPTLDDDSDSLSPPVCLVRNSSLVLSQCSPIVEFDTVGDAPQRPKPKPAPVSDSETSSDSDLEHSVPPLALERDPEPAANPHQRKARPADVADVGPVFWLQEVLCLVFGVEYIAHDTGLLIQALEKYKLLSFARANFREHLKGNLLKRKLRPKPIPLQQLIAFQRVPLAKPLLRKISTGKKRVATSLFELLLDFMRLRPSTRSHVSSMRYILHILCTNSADITDEFYFQLIKQTIDNNEADSVRLVWELMSIIASMVPPTNAAFPYIAAYVGMNALSPEPLLSKRATFAFLRLLTRHYIGTPFNHLLVNTDYPQRVIEEMLSGRLCLGVSLYECLYYQRTTHPKMPIPYVLYYIVSVLQTKGAANTQGFLRVRPDDNSVREILDKINQDVTVVSNGDVHAVGAVFKAWLRQLANPVIPVELVETFVEMSKLNKFCQFPDKLPTLHRLTLLYIIGYLTELTANAETIGLDKSGIAAQFGPLLVNPSRIPRRHQGLVQNLTKQAVAFCSRLIDSKDPNPIYPLGSEFLDQPDENPEPTATPAARPHSDHEDEDEDEDEDEPDYTPGDDDSYPDD
jgi:hypothetical protein